MKTMNKKRRSITMDTWESEHKGICLICDDHALFATSGYFCRLGDLQDPVSLLSCNHFNIRFTIQTKSAIFVFLTLLHSWFWAAVWFCTAGFQVYT